MKKNILFSAFIATALMLGCTGSSNNDPQPNNTNNPNNPSVPAFCKPTQMTVSGGNATLNYNANKQLTTINMPNNRIITFTYTNNRITRFTEAPSTGATATNTSTFDFTYDAQNQITKCDLSINGGTAIENNITYTPVSNSTDTNVNIAYRDGTALAGNGSYNFVIRIDPTTKAVNAYNMSYTQNTTCPNSVSVTASYNYNSTISGYTTTSGKTIWAEMNIPLPIRFFLNRYFISTSVNELSSNPIVVAYLSDVAPSSISIDSNGGGCVFFNGTTAHSYTHTTNNRNVVTATTVTQQTQVGNPPTTTTYNYTHNCD
jgi:hypothetical protein